MASLDALRRYAVVDPGTSTQELQLCMDAARVSLTEMGVAPLNNNALYDLTLYQLATHYFEHRADGEATKIPPGVIAALHQLR